MAFTYKKGLVINAFRWTTPESKVIEAEICTRKMSELQCYAYIFISEAWLTEIKTGIKKEKVVIIATDMLKNNFQYTADIVAGKLYNEVVEEGVDTVDLLFSGIFNGAKEGGK